MSEKIRKYLSDIGKRGGRKSRRTLDSETARNMVRLREAKRAFRRFYARCFWSYDPDYVLTLDDIEWVAKQLMKNGGREAWEVGAKLCH
jgi:hypothetical protein